MGTDLAIDLAARITGATTDVASRVTGAIRDAARQTGAGFEYLLNTAIRESNLNPNAKAKTSSATGLFQFIDQTWLGTLKQSGNSLGYGKYADAISRTPQGKFVVNDPAMREQIFALRKDPTANAVMAGAFANSNAKLLTDRLGRKPTDGELYIAHFLGASGAARFISAAEARPDTKAAAMFPRAASANSSIFYGKNGEAKSLKQVYAGLIAKHDVIGTSRFAAANPDAVKAAAAAKAVEPTKATDTVAAAKIQAPIPTSFFRDIDPPKVAATAAAAATAAPAAPLAAPVPKIVVPANRVADAHAVTAASGAQPTTIVPPAAAVAPVAATSAAASATIDIPSSTDTAVAADKKSQGPIFTSLFHEDQRGAVAPVVSELWGTRRVAAAAPAAAKTDAVTGDGAPTNAPLDLFNFLRTSARRPA